MKSVMAFIFVMISWPVFAQPYLLSPNAPKDSPQPVTTEQRQRFEAAIQPLVKEARASYPDAKRRFLAGLPAGETFFVTTNLHDPEGRFERVFVRVQSIKGQTISGTVASDILLVRGFKSGDAYRLSEAEVDDWLISKPDGTEEGNLVGKFLDTYRP
jgi:hypothetical protein